MAEIGNLAVRLSLDNAQFERSVKSMNTTLKAMGQEIRTLQNKGKDWGASLEGLRSKQEAYGRLLEGQQTKVRKLTEAYEKAKAEQGEHADKTQRLAEQLNRATAEMTRTETELNAITAELRRQEAELARSQSSWNKLGESLSSVGDKAKVVGDKMTSIGKDLSMKISAPLAALGVGVAKAAIDFESAFAGVRKTVDTSEEGFAKLEKGIRDMAKELPASASDIASVAESAGQLGIAEDKILSFSRTIIDLGESTNMTREQAATEFARFANIVGMSQDNFDRLGSSIVGLGNTMATTEAEIMSMGMRLAAQGAQVGMSEAQIMALAGTMSSLGIQAEMGGTAMTTVLKKIDKSVGLGGASLASFADAAGVTSKEFKKIWENDSISGLDLLIKGLAKTSAEGGNLSEALRDLGIKGIYESDVMMRMAGASDLLSSAVETSTTAWKENTALTNEAEERYKTTASQLAMLKNKVVEVGISFGQTLIPMLMSVVDKITPVIEKFAAMDESTRKMIIVVGGIVAAIGPVLVIVGTLVSSLGTVFGAFGTVSSAIAVATTGATAATPAIGALASVFTALTGPIGIAVAAISAIGIGTAVVAKEMSKSSLEVEGFGNKVSDSTSKAVGGFLKLSDEATVALNQLAWSGEVVTGEMATKMTEMYSQMGEQVLSKMKDSHASELEAMTSHFANTSSLSQQEEKAILERLQTRYTEQEKATEAGTSRIAEIMANASADHRTLTETEQIEINLIQETMKNNAIKYMSESEVEQKVILERLKNDSSIITAEQAAQVVQNSVKQKTETIKEAEDQYNEVLKWATTQRDETGVMSAEEAQKVIDDARHKRDEAIGAAEDMHAKVVAEAQKQAEEHVDKVNWETGEILSKWEVFKNKHSEIFDKIKEYYSKVTDSLTEITTKAYGFIKTTIDEKLSGVVEFVKKQLDKLKEFWDENGEQILGLVKLYFGNIKSDIQMVMGIIKGVFEIVWPIISNLVKVVWNTMKLTIGTALDLILGIIQTVLKLIQGDWSGAWETIKKTAEQIWGNIEGFFKGVNLVQIGKDIINGLIEGIGSMANSVKKKVEELANKLPEWAKKVLGIHSPSEILIVVTDKIGLKSISKVIKDSKQSKVSTNDKHEFNIFQDLLAQQFKIAGVQ